MDRKTPGNRRTRRCALPLLAIAAALTLGLSSLSAVAAGAHAPQPRPDSSGQGTPPRPKQKPTATPSATATLRPTGTSTATATATNTPTPTATKTPTPTATVPPSGTAMPVGDLPGWRQIFTEDFTTPVPLGQFPGTAYPNWSVYSDGARDNPGDGYYMPSRVDSVSGGALDYWFHTENGQHLIAASIPTLPGGQNQLYGRYSVRFRVDVIPGYKMAFLLWPQSGNWPYDGEIDFPEDDFTGTYAYYFAYTHHEGATWGGDQDWFRGPASDGAWHIATTEWTANRVTYTLDGVVIGVSTDRIPNTPMHWTLQTGRIAGTTIPDATAGHMQIDWAVAYAPA